MSDMQSMLFMQKLVKKYSGHTLKEQLLARKDRNGKVGDNVKRFAGILPEEQLKAMSHGCIGDLPDHLEYSTPMKQDHYIKNQYDKRNNLLQEADMNKIGTNSK